MSSVLPTNYLTPTGREEAWRFTPLKRIAGLHDPAVSVIDPFQLNYLVALELVLISQLLRQVIFQQNQQLLMRLFSALEVKLLKYFI